MDTGAWMVGLLMAMPLLQRARTTLPNACSAPSGVLSTVGDIMSTMGDILSIMTDAQSLGDIVINVGV